MTNRQIWFLVLSVPLAVGLAVLTAGAGIHQGLSFELLGSVSDFLAGPVYMLLLIWGLYLYDWLELPETSFTEEIFHENNLAAAIVIAALLIAWAMVAQPGYGQVKSQRLTVADTAQSKIGITESPPGSNRGAFIEKCLAHVDLGPGYPYCAACASLWLDQAGLDGPIGTRDPFDGEPIRSALSAHFMGAREWVPARQVRTFERAVPVGSVGVYLKGNSSNGHTIIVVGDDQQDGPWRGQCGLTVEANTTPSDTASVAAQRDGGGIWPRRRCIYPEAYFQLVGFAVPQS